MARDLRPKDLRSLDPLTTDQVTQAARLHACLQAHHGEWGHWEGGKVGADGAQTPHRVILTPIAQETYDWLLTSGVMPDFNWLAWPAKRELVQGNVSTLEPDVARALLTALIVQEHSSDGSLLGIFRHGIITNLLGVLGTSQHHPELEASPDPVDDGHPLVLEPI